MLMHQAMTGLTFLTFMAKAHYVVSRSPSTCPWPLQTMMFASCFLSGPRHHSLLPSLLFCPADLHFFNSGCYVLACPSDALSPCLAWDLLLSETANSSWSSQVNCWILSNTKSLRVYSWACQQVLVLTVTSRLLAALSCFYYFIFKFLLACSCFTMLVSAV